VSAILVIMAISKDRHSRAKLQHLLRQVRTEAGFTQSQVAEKLKLPQSYVSKYESGERRLDLLELEDVCNAIGIPLVEFVKRFLERLP
jgi:transcriptional regulator with XRE-family HTH domain